jgi:hypothetical protein
VDNTEGEDTVKVASRIDCVFEVGGELMLIKKAFMGYVMRNKVVHRSV